MRLMMGVILRRVVRIAQVFVSRPMTRPWNAARGIEIVVIEAGVETIAMVTDIVCLLPNRGKAVAVLRVHGMWNDVTQLRITALLKGIRHHPVRPEFVHRIV